jgi:hypothetical protein
MKLDISHLQEFGRTCWVLQQDGKNSKLDPKSHQFIFVGIADGTKGYRYYNSQTHQILTSWNVVFMAEEEKSDLVEIPHPASLEGESGNDGKQPLGENGDQAPEVEPMHHTSERETHHASHIPVTQEQSSHILAQPLVNYQLLNNLNAHGQKEWRHHVPTVESSHIMINYAMIGASLKDDPLLVKEA